LGLAGTKIKSTVSMEPLRLQIIISHPFSHWIMAIFEKKSTKVFCWAIQTIIVSLIFFVVYACLQLLYSLLFKFVVVQWIIYIWSGIGTVVWIISLILTIVSEDFVKYGPIGTFAENQSRNRSSLI